MFHLPPRSRLAALLLFEAEGRPVGFGVGPDGLDEGLAGMREGGAAAGHETEATFHVEFGDLDGGEGAGDEFGRNGKAWDEGDAVAALDKALDGFKAGEFDFHFEWGAVAAEGGDHFFAQRRRDVVGDEGFAAKAPDGRGAGGGQRVLRAGDADEVVAIHDGRGKLGVVGAEGEEAEFYGVLENVVGDAAGEGALDGDFDAGVVAAEGVEDGEEVEAGVFVGGKVEAAEVEGAKIGESCPGLLAKV